MASIALQSNLLGSSSIDADLNATWKISSDLLGNGALTADVVVNYVYLASSLVGQGVQSANAKAAWHLASNIHGTGVTIASTKVAKPMHGHLVGTSVFTAHPPIDFMYMSASLAGNSQLTAFATPEQGFDITTETVSPVGGLSDNFTGTLNQNTAQPFVASTSAGTINVYTVLPNLAFTIHGNGLYNAKYLPGLQGCIDCDYIVGNQTGPVIVMYDQGQPGFPPISANPSAVLGWLLDSGMHPVAFITDTAATIKAYSASTGPVLTAGQHVHARFSWNTRVPFASFTINGQAIAWTTYPTASWQAVMPTNIAVGAYLGGTTNGTITLAQIGRSPQ